MRSALPAPGGPWPARRCARLTLAGPSPLWQALRREGPSTLEAILRQELGLDGLVLRLEGLHPPLDLAALATRDDVLGRALTLTKQAQDDPAFLAKLAEELAPELHPDSHQAGPEQRQARLRELLEQATWLLAGGLRPNGPEGGDAA